MNEEFSSSEEIIESVAELPLSPVPVKPDV
jgi:hypothetical protein